MFLFKIFGDKWPLIGKMILQIAYTTLLWAFASHAWFPSFFLTPVGIQTKFSSKSAGCHFLFGCEKQTNKQTTQIGNKHWYSQFVYSRLCFQKQIWSILRKKKKNTGKTTTATTIKLNVIFISRFVSCSTEGAIHSLILGLWINTEKLSKDFQSKMLASRLLTTQASSG